MSDAALPAWSDPAFGTIADLAHARAGLVVAPARRPGVEAAMRRAMTRAGAAAPAAYLAVLRAGGPALDDLLAELTVGETYFFREPAQFEVLRREILPTLAGAGRPLRAWSAACATGEEPYSLAILLREAGVAAHVLGTDVARHRLLAARAGRYRPWSLRGVPDAVVRRWFREERDRWVLDASVRRAVEFRYLNLVEDVYPSIGAGVWGMDLVLCRNVLIYFDAAAIARVAERLLASLADDGWLLLAASDPPLAEYVRCDVVRTAAGVAYRRARRGAARALPHRAAPAPPEPVPPPIAAPSVTPPVAPAVAPFLAPPEPTLRDDYRARDYDRVASRLAALAPHRLDAPDAVLGVRALANVGRLADAERLCVAAVERHRDVAELHYLHAVLLGDAGHAAAAAAAARRALYLDPSLAVAHLALAAACQRLGRDDDARLALDAAARTLERLDERAEVPASDGEPAGRLLAMTRVQRALLDRSAA